jgi:hypothetical protein
MKIFFDRNGLMSFSTIAAGISDLMMAFHLEEKDVCMILKVLRSRWR